MHQAEEAIFDLRRSHARELSQFGESNLHLTKLISARQQNRKKQSITNAQPPTATWRRAPPLFRLRRSHLLFTWFVLFAALVALARFTSEYRKNHVRAREQHLQQLSMLRVGTIPYQCVHMTRT